MTLDELDLYANTPKNEQLETVTMSRNYYYLISLKYHLKVYCAKLKMCTLNPDATTIIKDL